MISLTRMYLIIFVGRPKILHDHGVIQLTRKGGGNTAMSITAVGISLFSCFPVGYREILVKIFFNLTLVSPVKIPIFMFLLPRLIARASQPDGSMTSFTLHFSRNIVIALLCGRGTPRGITEKNCTEF